MGTTYGTREEWLLAALDRLRPMFEGIRASVPAVRVSCGWPSRGGTAAGNRRLGECWSGTSCRDGLPSISVSPVLEEPVKVLEVLVHEATHAAVGCEAKHGPAFRRVALAVGLEGPMRGTHAGKELTGRLNALSVELGAYPHAALTLRDRKRQGTRMVLLRCASCGYQVRTTRKWIDVGLPSCPEGDALEPQKEGKP